MNDGQKQSEFERVVMSHTKTLMFKALQMTRNRSDSEDLVQETLVKAFKHFDRFRPGSNCRAWLLKIMTNTFITNWRRESRWLLSVSYDDVAEKIDCEQSCDVATPTAPSDSHIWDSPPAMLQIKAAIRSLPATAKAVVTLAILEGFSYEEIAEIEGLRLGTVKSRLHRARKQLQRDLSSLAELRGYESGCALER